MNVNALCWKKLFENKEPSYSLIEKLVQIYIHLWDLYNKQKLNKTEILPTNPPAKLLN